MKRFWTLNKVAALGVLGAFAMLLLELRFDHRHVLGEHWQSFVPLIYSGAMLVIGGVALWLWDRGGRAPLFWGFSLALIVGGGGFWMHNEGEPVEDVEQVLAAWSQSVVNKDEEKQGKEAEQESAQSGEKKDEQAMPRVSGIGLGLSPLVQFAIVPLVVLFWVLPRQ